MKKQLYIISAAAALVAISIASSGLSANKQPTSVSVSSVLAVRNIGDMVRDSYAIIIGVIEDTSANKEKSFYRPGEVDVVTTATVKVEQYLSNPHGLSLDTIEVKTLGGTVENLTFEAEGFARFEKDARMVIFLDRHEDGSFYVYGVAQGAYTINEDESVGTDSEKHFLGFVMTEDDNDLRNYSLDQIQAVINGYSN